VYFLLVPISFRCPGHSRRWRLNTHLFYRSPVTCSSAAPSGERVGGRSSDKHHRRRRAKRDDDEPVDETETATTSSRGRPTDTRRHADATADNTPSHGIVLYYTRGSIVLGGDFFASYIGPYADVARLEVKSAQYRQRQQIVKEF